jgi:hypothetical protein
MCKALIKLPRFTPDDLESNRSGKLTPQPQRLWLDEYADLAKSACTIPATPNN